MGMDPLFGGLIAGGISGLAGIFNTSQNNQNQQALLQQQEAYSTQMSNTAYQRATADMKAAGLNPMMMFGSGSAASTPQAPSAQPQQSALQSVGPSIDKAISTAVQMKTVDKMSEEISNMEAERLKRLAETRTEERRPELVSAEALRAGEAANLSSKEATLRAAALPTVMNEAQRAKNEMSINPTTRRWLDMMGYSGRKASETLSPVSNLVSSARGVYHMFGNGGY